MPHVKRLTIPDDTCYDSVKEFLRSAVEAVQAKYGAVGLTGDENDWGIGFIPHKEEPSSSNRSKGLLSMRRRAEFLGGTFEIKSSLGKATEILVGIPWLAEEE